MANSSIQVPSSREQVAEECARLLRSCATRYSVCHESLHGSFAGYFVAIYVLRAENSLLAYAKVFKHRPDDPWDTNPLVKIGGASLYQSLMVAVPAVLSQALNYIASRQYDPWCAAPVDACDIPLELEEADAYGL